MGIISGLLFIGDPHLSSRKPGRRTDKDFPGTVLGKLDQAFQIARKEDLLPVLLGDLFTTADDNNLSMLSRLLKLLREHFEHGGATPVSLVGNHDMKDVRLSMDAALAVVRESGLMTLLEDAEPLTIPGVATLWPLSYGQAGGIHEMDGRLLNTGLPVIALTHADFAFQGAYPGAAPLVEIPGVCMVVNGHMHKPAPDVRIGETLWCNPGNITRMSVDCEADQPSVWSWRNGDTNLTRHVLKHERVVFDRTGISVLPDRAGLKEEMTVDGFPVNAQHSAFAELLKAQKASDAPLTDDAGVLLEELNVVCTERKAGPVVTAMLRSLLLQQNIATTIEEY
jgi:predicted phosphodiesterase